MGINEEQKDKLAMGVLVAVGLILAYFAATMTISMVSPAPQDTLVVGLNTPFPPFEEVQNEKIVGFDVDLANAIGEKLGREVVIKDFSDYNAVLPALETGAIDIAISGITITPVRSNAVDFSVPYYNASQAVLAKKGQSPSAGDMAPQYFSGKKIGFQELTTSQSWVEANLYGQIELGGNQSFKDWNVGLQSLRLGSVDVLIMDRPVAETFAKENADLESVGVIETHEQYGVAVKKGDPQGILEDINTTITDMKQDGRYQEMIKNNFEV